LRSGIDYCHSNLETTNVLTGTIGNYELEKQTRNISFSLNLINIGLGLAFELNKE